MRLTTLFLLIGTLAVHAKGDAQKVTINEEKVPLQKIINIIKKQTGYGFNINLGNLDELPPVSVKVNGGSIKEALEQCLDELPISYYIGDNYVVLGRKKVAAPEEAAGFVPAAEPPVVGYVFDKDGKPLAGATVIVKNNPKIVATTNNSGRFEIKQAAVGEVLIVMFIGFQRQEFIVKGSEGNIIRLVVDDSRLDEVQVIAYGTTTRRISTGNVSTIKADVIEKQPVSNPLLALQGRVPGITVVQNSGVPGGGITVRIQGRNSMRSGNDPLYVVDGVPIVSQLPSSISENSILGNSGTVADLAPSAAGNPLSFINPADIASIDVLKDADATAIYGSRAANGAVLITLKEGKAGKMRADLNFQNGWSSMPSRLKVLNTREYLDMRYEAFKNDNIDWRASNIAADDLKVWDTTRYTNWQDELLSGVASFLTASISLSGGTGGTKYLISGTYAKEGTPFPGDFRNRRISVNFNISSISNNQKLNVRFSGNFMNNNNRLPSQDPTRSALFMEPNAPAPFNADGTLNWAPNAAGVSTFTTNPYIGILGGYFNTTNNFIGNWFIGYKLLPGLEIANSIGFTYTQTDQFAKKPTTSIPPESRSVTPNSANYGNRNINSWITEPQLTYKTKIGIGKLDVLIGGTILQNNIKNISLRGNTYVSDALLENVGAAATVTASASNMINYKYAALFGRLNYNWQDKYIVNLTARRDGSSRFGQNNRFHNFGAIGGAWIFSKQEAISRLFPWLSFGKLRASYGATGNDQIADFRYLTRYENLVAQVPYQGIPVLAPAFLPNPDLQWELTKKLSAGMNLGFINDKILFNVDYSVNTSDKQLNTYLVSSVTGFSNYVTNFPGTVRNKTWEFSLVAEIIRNKSFEWSANVNFSIPKNALVAFPDLQSSIYANTLQIGKPIDIQMAYKYAGVNPQTGMYLFESQHAGAITKTENPVYPDDLVAINLNPFWYGGIQNHLRYESVSLDLFIQFVKQNGANAFLGNGSGATPGSFIRSFSNQPTAVLNRWRAPGNETPVKKFSSQVSDPSANRAYTSDASITDASFARLKNVSISWQVTNKLLDRIGFREVKIFAQAQNLLTVTNYEGLNPETPTATPLLPPTRTITLGAFVGF